MASFPMSHLAHAAQLQTHAAKIFADVLKNALVMEKPSLGAEIGRAHV